MIDEIYKTLRDTAYDTSCELAKARGSFLVFDYEKEKNCPFIVALPDFIKEKLQQTGRRNISILTQAPTGSVSQISKIGAFDSFNVSSGIEPVFRNFYTRRKKINPSELNARIDFTDALGDNWQEFKIYHGNVQNYLAKFELDNNAELPNYFVTSDKIDWNMRVRLQGVEQKYIDHSISSTINLPRGTAPEVVAEIYLNAWKSGLKGITVYVEGSKDGVLLSEKQLKRPHKIVPVMAPKRPTEMPCDIHIASVKGKKWAVLVGLLDGEPYEVFTGYAENLHIPAKITKGVIVKAKKGKYDLHINDGEEAILIEDVIQAFDNPESAWATRMISVALRHGTPVDFIVEQLNKDGGIGDVNKVISRNLKKYIKDGMKVRTNVACENIKPDGTICGSSDLIYSEGCIKCLDCGWSKCN
jgi:ribonucleoside-diphosphate reductase alpha chain